MSNIYDKASLVLIPSGTKTSKVYSQKPTNGDGDFTFSRSTAATRVNASGNIEKETGNLLLQSNSFSTGWSFANSNVTGGQAGYDGSSDAWLLTKTAGFGRIQRGVSVSGVHTASVYVKAGSLNWCRFLMLPVASGTDPQVYINLSDGSLGSEYNNITATSTSVGNGWYRVTLTFQQAITEFRIYPADANNNVSGTGSIYIQDAQLEQGLVARDYIETTTTAIYGGITDNVPRLDYTDSSCPALLLEPQRTNINPYSEYFGTFWNALGSPTITSNYGVSPEGLLNATRFQTTDAGRGGMYASIAVNNGTTYTLSFYAKSLSGTQKLRIGADNGCVNPQGAETFEVTTEWQKFSKTITSTQGGWNIFFDNIESGSGCTGTYLNCDMLVYGFQVEAGSYATSYIPTYGSAVTRNQDDISTTFASPIPTTGNVSYFIHLDGSERQGNATGAHAAIRFQGNDYISYNNSGGGYHRFRVNVNSTANYYTGNLTKSQEAKLLAVINGNYIKIFMNGQQVNQGTLSGTPDLLSATQYTGVTNEALGPLPIKELLLISTALTDQEAIDLTTI